MNLSASSCIEYMQESKITRVTPMNLRDFAKHIGDKMMPHKKQGANCPSIMGWPEDDLSKWVASHRKETKGIICCSSQGKNSGEKEELSSKGNSKSSVTSYVQRLG
jgi:hypothetical protein